MNLLLESVLMGTGIAVWSLFLLFVIGYMLFNLDTPICYVLEYWFGRPDLSLRFFLWFKHVTGRLHENYIRSAEMVAESDDLDVDQIIDSYRNALS